MKHLTTLKYIDEVARAGSIRKAAESLSITATALNRRILGFEEELGVPIFERLPRGVRLSSAGELLVHHIREQISDLERVRSKIADLRGERRGHVSVACSQAMLPFFLATEISRYRRAHPAVTFGVLLRDRALAEQALASHEADIALVFEPTRLSDFQTLVTIRQPIYVVLPEGHPLAQRDTLRLRECLLYPVALPTAPFGVRHLLEMAVAGSSLTLEPALESDSFEFLRNYAAFEDIITFQIPIGLSPDRMARDVVIRPLDERDAPAGRLFVGQLKGRTLPVAAARFADQIVKELHDRFPET